jgi:non-ribosomal peptide synthetase component F
MLNMISYESDIVVSLITNNRPEREDGDKLLGCFVNSVPFRIKIPGKLTWRDYIHMVNRKLIQLKRYEKMTFFEIVKIIGERNRAQNPISDTIFSYIDFHIYRQAVETVTQTDDDSGIMIHGFERANTLFDFIISGTTGKLAVELRYNTSIIHDEQVDQLFDYFKNILDLIDSEPGEQIRKDKIVSPGERQKLLYEFNDTKAGYPKEKTIHQLFEEQAVRTGDRIAVVSMAHDTQHLAYRELDIKSNQLACRLMEKGVQPGTIAGLMVERSLEMITGILGILKAGGAYLPIDPGYPEERIRYLLTDSKAKVLVTSPGRNFCFDEEEIPIMGPIGPIGPIKPIQIAASLAYVIYTSGSTGRPKGVGIEHASLVNRLNWMQRRYPLDENDTILQKTPFTFDVSVWELLWWAVEGARVCFLVPGGEKDPAVIADTIERVGISVIHFVPSMLSAFLEYVKTVNAAAKLLHLKQVFASGEALTLLQVKAFDELLHKPNGTKLANLYGPTEAAIDVTYFDCTTGEDLEKVPIGKSVLPANCALPASAWPGDT